MKPLRLLRWSLSFLGTTSLLVAQLPSTPAKIKVACIGDSITEGVGASVPYPTRLQSLLGTNYQVRNFGVSGRTLLSKGDFPYIKEAFYKNSLAFLPDVVVIKLGSNDAKPQNWRHGTNYMTDYEALISSYTSLSSHPRVFLCTPCPAIGNGAFDISPTVVHNAITPQVRQLTTNLSLGLIEIHQPMLGHAEWFPDLIHPNDPGAIVMATLVSEKLREVLEPPADPLPAVPILSRQANGQLSLTWPNHVGRWVVQNANKIDGKASTWTVLTRSPIRAGDNYLVTNLTTSGAKFYRLLSLE